MKNFKIFFRVFVYISISLLLLSCEMPKDKDNGPSTKTECYDVFDAFDNHPIAGASVTMNHMMTSGYWMPYNGLTDSSGHICNEYDTYLPAAEELWVWKSGYMSKCPKSGAPPKVYLTPLSAVKLHLQNIAPAHMADTITVNYPAANCNKSYNIYFYGKNVDTTMVYSVWAGANKITWNANGIIKDSVVTFTRLDTIFFEILY
jgi:hypothetical protein